ncbi:MAG: N-acetylmuramoyl-L-alanine amidase [Halioglobus sp.]|nr:N-acetylmuramoyl-L-alanine amidase [Halioglobus sp.]
MGRTWIGAMLGMLLAFPAWSVEVHDVRLWRAPDHTRIVFDLTGPASHKLVVLDNPDRLVLDVANTRMKAGVGPPKLAGTPVNSLRTMPHEGNSLRVVLELNTVVNPRSFFLSANQQASDRLVLDLYDKAPPKQAVATRTEQHSDKRNIIIAIDAGHGGEDPGATGPNKQREKHIVMAIARELNALLQADRGFRPTMIRTGDYYISLAGRRDLARQRQADLFVSIHADAFNRREAHGASVYALSTQGATSTAASYLAERENASDLVGGVTLSDKDVVLAGVLADLSMTSTLDNSLKIGSKVLRQMDSVAELHKRSVEQAGFAVLKSPDIPSILVETGFISNPAEAQLLSTSAYQKKMARAIHSGIREWFLAHPPAGTLVAWQRQQNGQQYTIARGDTLSTIAQRFNVSEADLRDRNGISGEKILVGQKLLIPAS